MQSLGDSMLNFIIIDDDQKFNNTIKNSITKAMFQQDIDYTIQVFPNNSTDLQKTINNKQSKIYIININTSTQLASNGIELAKSIRQDDWESQIIFINHYNINVETVIRNRILPFDLIYKFENNFEQRISKDINHIMKMKSKDHFITIKQRNSIITIPIKDILYITRDSTARKCQIVTSNKNYFTHDNLNNIFKSLNNRFVKSHRACIINIDKVQSINLKNHSIMFDNNTTINLISRNYKKDVIEKLKLKY